MTQATTHNTTTPRRAHPAVVRAALRSCRASVSSYPRRRVSSLNKHWIPAFAGMTRYNALGQKSSQTYPDGATYNYSYDTNNQLSTVGLPTGFGSITLNSYLWTVPSQITLPGGTVRNLRYDGLLRLKELSVKDPGQSQVMSTQYGYDLTGNIVSKATEQSTTNYGYDPLDHLTSAAYTAAAGSSAPIQTNEAYSYDPLANRTSSATTASYSYNANNQLTQAGSIRYTYDENGNTTSQTDANNSNNTRSYVYDTDNRLIEVHDASNAIVATYRYDPFGRRISKTLNNGSQSNTTYYFYSAEGLIAEADSNGQLTKSYGYAPGSTFSTNPLWMKVPASGTQTAATYYTYQNDHLGTPQKLLNQSGITVWSATYDAFGRATVDPSSTVSNSLRYPGQYADAETGMHYNWMRYYDPNTGRYSTSDPIGLMGGMNIYTYVSGNSMRWIDSRGLRVGTTTGAVQASVMVIAVGVSMSAGGVVGTDHKKCESYQICFRFGGGMYAGVGLVGGLGTNAGGTADSGGFSVGVGGDAALGAGVGGQASIGVPSPTSGGVSKGSLGLGIGLSAGIDFCYTYVSKCRDCQEY